MFKKLKTPRHSSKNVDQVVDIQSNIKDLRDELSKVVSHTNKTAGELENGSTLVNQVIEANKSVVESIEQLNNEALQIAANTQEQTAVTAEFASKASELSQSANNILTTCNETGKGIFKVSQLNNQIRQGMVKDISNLKLADFLDLCMTDHLNLRWRIYNMLLGYETIDASIGGNPKECRLGKWYYSDGKDIFKDNAVFKRIEEPHVQLHKWAKESVLAVSSNNMSMAEQAFKEMDFYSDKVIETLEELKQYTLKNQ